MSGFVVRVLAVVYLAFAPVHGALGQVDITEINIAELLARAEAPSGVVFEIVEGDEEALEVLIPLVRQAIDRLRDRFPGSEFAVVSHGREQFALESRYREALPAIHEQVSSLVADQVPVHVCGTHAGWYGVEPEDFPDFVDVAPSGPGQIRLYQEMGYDLVIVQ